MKRFRLVVLAVCIAPVSFFSASPARAIQCSIERPSDARSFWSYRLIDGRKCWYEGKPMLSKSLLEWPALKPAEPASDKASTAENPVALNDDDAFEARWRARFLDAMGKY
jgi:hypothetical protein